MSNAPDDRTPPTGPDESTDDSPAEFIDRPQNLPGDKVDADPSDHAEHGESDTDDDTDR